MKMTNYGFGKLLILFDSTLHCKGFVEELSIKTVENGQKNLKRIWKSKSKASKDKWE